MIGDDLPAYQIGINCVPEESLGSGLHIEGSDLTVNGMSVFGSTPVGALGGIASRKSGSWNGCVASTGCTDLTWNSVRSGGSHFTVFPVRQQLWEAAVHITTCSRISL